MSWNWVEIVIYIDYLLFLCFTAIANVYIVKKKFFYFYAESLYALNHGYTDSILQMSSNNNGFPGNLRS